MAEGYSPYPPPDAPFEKVQPPNPPIGRRSIGFRGNLQHGKALNDPVYPTVKVPTAIVPRFQVDWRNGGRALLCASMALLEGYRIRRHRQSLDWQRFGFCGQRCGSVCAKSQWRCLCAWRVRGLHYHYVKMDASLMSYKGVVKTQKPLFSIPRAVALENSTESEALEYDSIASRYVQKSFTSLYTDIFKNAAASVYPTSHILPPSTVHALSLCSDSDESDCD